MTLFIKASRLIFLTCCGLLLLAGCSERPTFETLSEEEDPVFRRARDLYARGMENEALENFLKLIQKRNGNAPESHLDAGNIYLKHLHDPISAIYHFKKYEALMRRSDEPDAQTRISLVRDLIKSATKEFATTFDAKVYQDPLERLKLLDTIEMLRSENELLKQQLADARSRLNDNRAANVSYASQEEDDAPSAPQTTLQAQASPRFTPQAPEPTGRVYTIQSGDSLYRIARRMYGDANRWRDILEANRDLIPDETNLKVGTEIRIP
ncbi:LysM peptidoglycan-binding domain-containing protein [Pelagicoccus sp. SDUM812003]|uniref:LysM peptidoglycan-binding domain-containing protein n=1 Tax=Pelagicoccus sp. SDUM812003 TaxID=3041267 RepID=UPI00280DCBA3|nr:LysM peptidoglycan-binding domain-containing protein [Pelagicoccus sp. SDUM812003]MDQ8201669.1 LysM peptidoglycan-binding domain-containing protein [Pelagicoccus sp. SDUM812003]